LTYELEIHDTDNYQGNAVVNYTDENTPYTRVYEHKHFEFGTQPKTVITREFPAHDSKDTEPYYPVNDTKNMLDLKKYQQLAEKESRIIFGGRLAEYRYYDMHQVIASALTKVQNELKSEK
jgi:UDP-galactopyranose mutase